MGAASFARRFVILLKTEQRGHSGEKRIGETLHERSVFIALIVRSVLADRGEHLGGEALNEREALPEQIVHALGGHNVVLAAPQRAHAQAQLAAGDVKAAGFGAP